MNTIDAGAVLDRVKEGHDYSPQTIAWALVMTGDMDESEYQRIYAPVRSAGVAGSVSEKDSGIGQAGSAGLVG